MGAPPEVQALIAKFREGTDYWASSSFREMSLRSKFLNPVLKAFGWPRTPTTHGTYREWGGRRIAILDPGRKSALPSPPSGRPPGR